MRILTYVGPLVLGLATAVPVAGQPVETIRFDVAVAFEETLTLTTFPDLFTISSNGDDLIEYHLGPLAVDPAPSLSLPMDTPCPTIGYTHDGHFVVGDRVSTGGVRLSALRFDLVSKTLILVDQRFYGWSDVPELLAIVNSRVIAYSRSTRRLRVASWVPGSALPTSFSSVSADPLPFESAPSRIRVTGTDDCTLYIGSPLNVPSDHESRFDVKFPVGSMVPSIVPHSVDQVLGSVPVSQSWDVQVAYAPSSRGDLRVRGGTGSFEIRVASSGDVVATGVRLLSASDPAWTTLDLSSAPIVPGTSYHITGSGFGASRMFRPCLRYGEGTETTNLRAGRGFVSQTELVLGNSAVEVYGEVLWITGESATSGELASMYMAVDVVPAGTDPTTTLTSGAVVLANPLAVYGPVARPLNIQGGSTTQWGFSVPALTSLEGMDIVFQNFCALSSGETVASDVFGGRIRALTGGAGPASSQASFPGQMMTVMQPQTGSLTVYQALLMNL